MLDDVGNESARLLVNSVTSAVQFIGRSIQSTLAQDPPPEDLGLNCICAD